MTFGVKWLGELHTKSLVAGSNLLSHACIFSHENLLTFTVRLSGGGFSGLKMLFLVEFRIFLEMITTVSW